MRICCESSFQWHAIICFTVFVLFVIHIHTSVHVFPSLFMYLIILLGMFSMCIFSHLFHLFIIFTFTPLYSVFILLFSTIWPIFLGKGYMKSLPELACVRCQSCFCKLSVLRCPNRTPCACLHPSRLHAAGKRPCSLDHTFDLGQEILCNANGMTPHSLLLLEPGRPSGLYTIWPTYSDS